MLNYSFSTVLMAVLTSNLIIVLIALCFRHKNILLSVGYKVLIVFLFLTLVRFVFPFELPVARNIYLPELLSKPLTYFRYPFLKFSWISVSLWTVFEIIWLIGIFYHIYHYLHQHASLPRQVIRYSVDVTDQEPYAKILTEVCGQRKVLFRVLKVHGITTPSVFGIIKPKILIPAKMQLTEEHLYYIFCHETSHYLHHDIWIKCCISFMTILYWWNPICRVFKMQVDQLLEMRVDDSLVNNGTATVLGYLHTLLYIKEESAKLKLNSTLELPENFLLSFSKNEGTTALTRRFEMLCQEGKKRFQIPLTVLLFALVFSMYVGSYLVTFETSYLIEQFGDNNFISGNGLYAILKSDGTYDIYYNELFIENLSSLEYYSDDISVYK